MLARENSLNGRANARNFYNNGKDVKHRSCGISLAETFGRQTAPYQALRKGGLTGQGECGAIKAGELILGEVFGDPDPAGSATPTLTQAAIRYRELWDEKVERGPAESIICNTLTAPFMDFKGPARHRFCTRLATQTAQCVAQVIVECDGTFHPTEPPTE